MKSDYAELQVSSNFSFLRGASHPEELAVTAAALGLNAFAMTDRNTLAGVVRAHVAAKQAGIRLIVGARLDLEDAPSLLCFPTDRAAYGRLARLISLGRRRAPKGECRLMLADVLAHGDGQIIVLLLPPAAVVDREATVGSAIGALKSCFRDRLSIAANVLYRGDDTRRLADLATFAARHGVRLVATNDVHAHSPHRRPFQDVLTCIREHCTIAGAGYRLFANAERHLKPPAEMARLFRAYPDAIARTIEIADACRFSLDELRYEYPIDPVPDDRTPQEELTRLTRIGARERYPDGVPDSVSAQIEHELALIGLLSFAPYFLTVHDIVRFARERGILCQGRGSAANSSVCFCLGITSVDPARIDLLFERFVSAERNEPPDIDVDFEHERREEVIQYVYGKYGRERAGMTATVITYRTKSALRETGKVMGLSEDSIIALQKVFWRRAWDEVADTDIRDAGLDPGNRTVRMVIDLAGQLHRFPRHLSQHTGGMVITKGSLCEVVPIENAAMEERTVIEWDKDDLDALGMMKVDVLALGMLTCIRKALDLLRRHKRIDYDLAQIPKEDAAVYEMLSRGDSLGVFQVESRAQMNMLPRMRPKEFYDLVIEVAIVRPGPIQGDMVHPYLKRRNGIEEVKFPSPSPDHGDVNELHEILGRTKGVPLFQEQAMELAITAAKFSPDEANGLRKAMATFRNDGTMWKYKEKFINRMIARGYDRDFVERCYKQIEGFGSYGFPESHAVSFALLVYASSWLKCHHPEAFCCAILNSQPMGFYTRASLVRDAREHGAEVREIDVNFSEQDNILEPSGEKFAVRLGFRNIDGFQDKWEEKIVQRRAGGFPSLESFAQRTQLPKKAILLLADADCFRSIGLDRRAALWSARRLPNDDALPLFAALNEDEHPREEIKPLPVMPLPEHVVADYQTAGLSLKGHPMEFLREIFSRERVYSCRAATNAKNGSRLRCAGAVLVRQRPGTAKGVVFMTIEDETGIANIVIWQNVFERYRKEIMGARLVLIEGRIQRADGVTHLVAERLEDRSAELHRLSEWKVEVPLARTDEVSRPQQDHRSPRHPRNVRILPRSRDFH
ncbi:MAG: error-prone DNA polymerase [Xanthobacteraceae bacterium]|nr:error-prone DNA polymerase [Xanthobacteraceae bacterium]